MNAIHPTEEQLQFYAVDPVMIGQEIKDHITHCNHCASVVASYQQLLKDISLTEAPAFSFDLSAEVLSQLPSVIPSPGNSPVFSETLLLVLIPSVFISVMAIVFRKWLMSVSLFPGTMATYLIGISVITLLGFLCIDLYQTFQKKIKSIELIH